MALVKGIEFRVVQPEPKPWWKVWRRRQAAFTRRTTRFDCGHRLVSENMGDPPVLRMGDRYPCPRCLKGAQG